MTNKEWRNSIYEYLTSTGYIFNHERHKMLKQLLNAREQSDDDFNDGLEPDEDLETDDQL